jgi:outer membrane murein-binding lipoprotein Lpp
MKIKTIAAALAALCAIVGCGNRKCRENVFSAVKDGRAAADIVLPVKAHDIERYAAKELAYHIAEASGV